jgi:hypothetical protein
MNSTRMAGVAPHDWQLSISAGTGLTLPQVPQQPGLGPGSKRMTSGASLAPANPQDQDWRTTHLHSAFTDYQKSRTRESE